MIVFIIEWGKKEKDKQRYKIILKSKEVFR